MSEEPLDVRVARVMGCTPLRHPAQEKGLYGRPVPEWWSCGCEKGPHNIQADGNGYGSLIAYSSSGEGLLDMLEWMGEKLFDPDLECVEENRWECRVWDHDGRDRISEQASGPCEAAAKALLAGA